MATINIENVRKIIEQLKTRVEQEADILHLYVIAFGSVIYYDEDADPEVRLVSLYQYLYDQISEFISGDFSLSSFDAFLYDLVNGADFVSIYRYNGYNLIKLYPECSYDDSTMGITPICHTLPRGSEINKLNNLLTKDDYLISFINHICGVYGSLNLAYQDAKNERNDITHIRGNVSKALYKAMGEMESRGDEKEIIEFYDYMYKQITNYKREEGK